MKIAIAQLNYTIGDVDGNASKIIDSIHKAKAQHADLVIFAEQAVSGTPAFDLLRKTTFLELCEDALVEIASCCDGIAAIVGLPILTADGTISFAGKMSSFTLDGVTTATPLNVMKTAWKAGESNLGVDLMAMFIGKIPGTIGEVSVVALLIGAAYLVFKKVISLRIPLTYIVTVAVFVFIFGRQDLNFVLAHIFGGGLIFGAFFMATDYVTSPITPKGQIVFGILLGVLTGTFRLFGGSAEGVSYAIIISNLMVPLIERYTLPVAFGKEGKKA